MPFPPSLRPALVLAAMGPVLAGCAGSALTDHECMTRVMYFESNRSSPEGMLAVGTTVMNRVDSPKYPKDVCAVVGQSNQFAPGVLDKPMNPREAALPARMADKVLAGERHPQMPADAMFFHTAGLSFPYPNMHYVLVAGGNAFYEKLNRAERTALARATPRPTAPESPPQDEAEAAGGQPFVSTFDPAASGAAPQEGAPPDEEN